MKVWRKFYECECHGEVIALSIDEDWGDAVEPEECYLAFFTNCFPSNSKYGWRQKIRHCWHILRTGWPWCDMVVLDKDTAREMGYDLIEFAEKEKADIAQMEGK